MNDLLKMAPRRMSKVVVAIHTHITSSWCGDHPKPDTRQREAGRLSGRGLSPTPVLSTLRNMLQATRSAKVGDLLTLTQPSRSLKSGKHENRVGVALRRTMPPESSQLHLRGIRGQVDAEAAGSQEEAVPQVGVASEGMAGSQREEGGLLGCPRACGGFGAGLGAPRGGGGGRGPLSSQSRLQLVGSWSEAKI